MNTTKAMQKKMKAMTDTEIVLLRDQLTSRLSMEKNPMIRSSLFKQISICTNEIQEGNRPRLGKVGSTE